MSNNFENTFKSQLKRQTESILIIKKENYA